jgi:hypothetical protein
MRDNDGSPTLLGDCWFAGAIFACCSGRGHDRLDRLADPDSVLVGRVRGYRYYPRRGRRMKSSAALAQVTAS